MTLSDLGALGEFFGAFAVFATLLFLAMQVRFARRASEDTSVIMRSQSMREILLALARDPELNALYVRWLPRAEDEVLAALGRSDMEVSRFANICLSVLVTLQSSWLTDRSPMGLALTRSRLRWQLERPGCRAVWTAFRDVHFYSDFRDEIDALVDEIRRAPPGPPSPPPAGLPGSVQGA
ncbi:MAG: hypothetical protein V2I63_09145, partial [Pseudomonadales bacterium]|nr:hypothetical protein [Pseudomonadales bacterium]